MSLKSFRDWLPETVVIYFELELNRIVVFQAVLVAYIMCITVFMLLIYKFYTPSLRVCLLSKLMRELQ